MHVFYSDARKKAAALEGLRECDVLITTPHMVLPHGIAGKIKVRTPGVGLSPFLTSSRFL